MVEEEVVADTGIIVAVEAVAGTAMIVTITGKIVEVVEATEIGVVTAITVKGEAEIDSVTTGVDAMTTVAVDEIAMTTAAADMIKTITVVLLVIVHRIVAAVAAVQDRVRVREKTIVFASLHPTVIIVPKIRPFRLW